MRKLQGCNWESRKAIHGYICLGIRPDSFKKLHLFVCVVCTCVCTLVFVNVHVKGEGR